MSNRSLLEFNHDYAHAIISKPDLFMAALASFLRSADDRQAEDLRRFGITWHGTRHHSEPWAERISDRPLVEEKRNG